MHNQVPVGRPIQITIQNLRQQISSLEAEIQNKNDQISNLMSHIQSLQNQLSSGDSTVNQLQQQINNLLLEGSKKQQELNEIKKTLNILLQEKKQAEENYSSSQNENEILKAELEATKKEKEFYRSEYENRYQKDLFKFFENNELEKFAKFLDLGLVDIDIVDDETGLTLLQISLLASDLEKANFLLEHNANLLALSSTGKNTIQLIAEQGNLETLEFILEKYPKTTIDAKELFSVLENVRDEKVSKLLLNNVLQRGSKQGNAELVKKALLWGADVNCKHGKADETALHSAIYNHYFDVVKILLEHGANLEIGNQDGITSMSYAEDYKKVDANSRAIFDLCASHLSNQSLQQKNIGDINLTSPSLKDKSTVSQEVFPKAQPVQPLTVTSSTIFQPLPNAGNDEAKAGFVEQLQVSPSIVNAQSSSGITTEIQLPKPAL